MRRVGLILLIVGILPWAIFEAAIALATRHPYVAADDIHRVPVHGITPLMIVVNSLPLAVISVLFGVLLLLASLIRGR